MFWKILAVVLAIIGLSILALMTLFAIGFSPVPGVIDQGNFVAELSSLTVEACLFTILFSVVLPRAIQRRAKLADDELWYSTRSTAYGGIINVMGKTIDNIILCLSPAAFLCDASVNRKDSIGQVPSAPIALRFNANVPKKLRRTIDDARNLLQQDLERYAGAMTPGMSSAIVRTLVSLEEIESIATNMERFLADAVSEHAISAFPASNFLTGGLQIWSLDLSVDVERYLKHQPDVPDFEMDRFQYTSISGHGLKREATLNNHPFNGMIRGILNEIERIADTLLEENVLSEVRFYRDDIFEVWELIVSEDFKIPSGDVGEILFGETMEAWESGTKKGLDIQFSQ